MNKEVSADLKFLKFIFEKNKLYLFPSLVILLSIVLFFQFVFPQFRTLLSVRNQAQEANLRLNNLKNNLNILSNINEDSLDSQLKTVNLALPVNKDFSGILSAIYYASGETGAILGSFSFQVGDILESGNGGQLENISISLPITADMAKVNEFAQVISNTLPLSDVSLIKIGNQVSTVNLSFYYKPLSAIDSAVSGEVSISPLSQNDISLINELSDFKNRPSFSNVLVNANASSSAQPPSPF